MPGAYRGGYPDEGRFRTREFERPAPRFGSLRGSTRGALAMDPRRMAMLFDEGSPLSKITTLRPKDYSEARTIGERFRDGTPVIMDLVTMDNADAKRLVDFAAGLAFALRGSFDKVATKVFLLSPADVDVTPDDRGASPRRASTPISRSAACGAFCAPRVRGGPGRLTASRWPAPACRLY